MHALQMRVAAEAAKQKARQKAAQKAGAKPPPSTQPSRYAPMVFAVFVAAIAIMFR